jgi:hypothetical protein
MLACQGDRCERDSGRIELALPKALNVRSSWKEEPRMRVDDSAVRVRSNCQSEPVRPDGLYQEKHCTRLVDCVRNSCRIELVRQNDLHNHSSLEGVRRARAERSLQLKSVLAAAASAKSYPRSQN